MAGRKAKRSKRKSKGLESVQDYLPIREIQGGVIETTDGRYIRILEIEPINFTLRSDEEQFNIISTFASWLKISPMRLQFKSITRKADSDRHVAMIRSELEREDNPQCRAMGDDYIRLIRDVGSREALTRRFFLIFEYESVRGDSDDYAKIYSMLQTAEQTARAYFNQCGNSIVRPSDPDEAAAEILYMFFNRRSCVDEPFSSRVNRVVVDTMASRGKIIGLDPVPHIRIANFLAPRGIDLTHYNYIVMDGLYYGYHGNISQNWMTGNASDADSLSYAIATQMLVWEVVVGERDANFDHVDPSAYGKGAVMDYIGASNPLRSQIMSYYNQIIENIKTHNVMPSFCAPSRDYARAYELEQDGSEYTLTLTDSNGVLDNYAFSANVPGISFSKSGNRLTITCDTPTEETILVTAEKQNAYSSSLVIWSDGTWSKAGVQDTITYGENVSDPVNGYFELEMDAAGGLRIVKTSEDGNVSGIEFTITGEDYSERVRTGSDGTIDVTGLMPGRYTVAEINSDAYTPQDSQTVTIAGGESAVVTFNNTLKRGALQVRKSAEDNGSAAEEDLRGIKLEYRRKGIIFIAAAIGDDKPDIERIYGDSFLDITDLTQLPVKLTNMVKRYIRV